METKEGEKCCETRKCRCICHKMDGLFYLAVGILILLWACDVIHGSVVWIIVGAVVAVAGLQKLLGGFCKCCDRAGSSNV